MRSHTMNPIAKSTAMIVLHAVIKGDSLTEAGRKINKSSTTARHLLTRICNEFRLPSSIEEIRRNKSAYIDRLSQCETAPVPISLNPKSAETIRRALGLADIDKAAIPYLSNIRASQLIARKCSPISVSEIQEWLTQQNASLKRHPPCNESEIALARRAMNLLDAFYFDTSSIRAQLANLTADNE